MIVITSANGRVGIGEAVRVLRAGGSALDAVEAGARLVEANAEDNTVGYGGLPNLRFLLNRVVLKAVAPPTMRGTMDYARDTEHALQTLQTEYQNLVEQLTAERAHAERLAALADRFGAR